MKVSRTRIALLLPLLTMSAMVSSVRCSDDRDDLDEETCSDGIQNGVETDVDCGGGDCAPCAEGAGCLENTDCRSGYCAEGGTCRCLAGYAPDSQGDCADIDECATFTDNCSDDATCLNTTGAFTCTCHTGYLGDGVVCTRDSGVSIARDQMKPLVDAACDWMFGCCSSDELVYQLGGFTTDASNCSERLLDAILSGIPLDLEQSGLASVPAEALLVLASSINEGRVEVDGDAVTACADESSGMACNAPPLNDPSGRCTPGDAEVDGDPCAPGVLFRGLQTLGEECRVPWECAEGLRCVEFGDVSICARFADQGEHCFSDEECAEDLLCEWASGTCQEGAQAGEACAFADEGNPIPGTETIRCLRNLSCDPVTHTCSTGYCLQGAPCSDIFSDTDCPVTTYCVGNFATRASCQVPGGVGAPCSKAADCQSGFCDPFDEECKSLLSIGELCFDNLECVSGFCNSFLGYCASKVGPGQPCPSFNSDECFQGYCDTSVPAMPTCRSYSTEGGSCPTGIECDPEDDLACVDGVCRRAPYELGISCAYHEQCQSLSCYQGVCTAGVAVGDSCSKNEEKCVVGAYCQTPTPDALEGVCVALLRSGQPCTLSEQCWGNCVIRFGQQMCDAEPASLLGEAWCDGR
ncbi:MAG: calcium-binding EGF-like domain-containing protein [Polyangia bacterium]|nr:calcium-binding EGF-like domain-containing protein [Polyangia bacterium]